MRDTDIPMYQCINVPNLIQKIDYLMVNMLYRNNINYSTIQQFNYPIVQLFNYPSIQLSNYSAPQ